MRATILISVILLAACAQSQPSAPPVEKRSPESDVMCTMDAIQCADGNWVGRSPPSCEFNCPTAAADK